MSSQGNPCEHNELERIGDLYVCRKMACDARFQLVLMAHGEIP